MELNQHNKRQRHLFQTRDPSIACDKDPYLPALHLNPLRAGIINTPQALTTSQLLRVHQL